MEHVMEGTPNVSVGMPGLPLADSAAGSPASGTDLLRAFAAISKALNLAQPLSDTLDLIAEKVAQTMGHKYCAVLLADKETGELRLKGSFGLSDEYVRAINAELVQKIEGEGPEARSITAQAYRTRMPVYAADITVDPRFERWREAALETGYKSIAALPLIFRDEPIGVLNCYDEPRRYTQDQIDAMMVVAEQTASAVGIARLITEQRATIAQLNALNERVVTQYALLERSERAHEALTALLLENRSLDDITRTVAELLQALIVLCDEHSTVWSQSAPDDGDLKRPGRDNDDHLLQLRPFLPELREAGRAKEFKFGSGYDGRGSLIVVPVDMGGHGAGYLSALLTEESERDFSLRTLEQASTVYALYMTRQHIVQETENRIKGDLLADLLASRLSDDSEIRERAGYLGVDFSRGTYRILVMRSEPLAGYLERRGGNPGRAAQARAKLLTLARGFAADINAGPASVLGDRMVILVPERGDHKSDFGAQALLDLVQSELPDLRIRIAVSAACSQLKDLAPRYGDARDLLDLADALSARSGVVRYDDYGVYGLLIHAGDRDEILKLAHRYLDPLLERDADSNGHLLLTLKTYLDNALSPSRTAGKLFVHVNTVNYRLKRIADLLDLDLTDLDVVLAIRVALMIRTLNAAQFDAGSGNTSAPSQAPR